MTTSITADLVPTAKARDAMSVTGFFAGARVA